MENRGNTNQRQADVLQEKPRSNYSAHSMNRGFFPTFPKKVRYTFWNTTVLPGRCIGLPRQPNLDALIPGARPEFVRRRYQLGPAKFAELRVKFNWGIACANSFSRCM
jgi:hypothetical protein